MHANIAHSSWNYPVKHPQAITDPQLACSDCCDECSAPFTPQCNEKCMIVPCYNPEYSGLACHLLNEDCENVDCVSTIIPDCKGHREANNCGECYDDYNFDSHRSQNYVSGTSTPFQMDASTLNHFLYDRGPQSSLMSPSSPPSSGSSVSSQADFMFSPKDTASIASTVSMPSPPTSPPMHPGSLVCMWGDCHARFSSLHELVGHVNVVHLQPSTQRLPKTDSISQATVPALQCQWRDCHAPHSQVPIEQTFPTTDTFEGMLNMLTNHLLHDHLMTSGNQSPLLLGQSLDGQFHGPTSILPLSSQHEPAKNTTHPCHWKSCTEVFATLEDLTTHITNTHVGSGKAQYECFWDDCNRNGTNGFSSKQKICRHIQSHTGHRPFQCKVCNQNFSEAATLQQHMRRHTHEKPYVCDFPGCKKSFAIAGALTIHKRVHNGEKPFKCKYCDKAFAESSNLSKHLRTHTGVRPYTCPEPSCGKSFARPDQLTRHSLVHKKRGSS